MNNSFFYVGSCRYMGLFNRNFPARLHSTKEVIQLLENIGNIRNQLFDKNLNYMYGDFLHPIVKEKSFKFIENEQQALTGVTSFVMEISSRKYIKSKEGDILCSFYYNQPELVITLDDQEVESDILKIKYLLKSKFNIENIYIIPHLDLTFPDGSHIKERRSFKNLLNEISNNSGINFLDVSNAFSGKNFDAAFYDTTHYSQEGTKTVFNWLRQTLNEKSPKISAPQITPALINSQKTHWIKLIQSTFFSPLQNITKPGQLKSSLPIRGSGDFTKYKDTSHLEFLGRTLCGIAPHIEISDLNNTSLTIEQLHLGIHSVTNPDSSDYLNFDMGYQPLVDIAFFALAFLRSPKVLWGGLPENTKQQVITAFKSSRAIKPHFNNWLLFSAMIEAFFFMAGEDYDKMRIDYALRQHEQWYLGDGHYGDGPHFHADYYNSYVILPFLLQITQTLKGQFKDWDNLGVKILERAKRYAEVQERMISPDGTFPPVGRSIAYRGGAFHLLAQLALMKQLPTSLTPAQVRGALWAVIEKTLVDRNNYDENGWLRIGLNGYQPSLGENYISTGSLYLTSVIFLPLGLPEGDEFWSAQDEPWTQKKVWWFGYDISADKAI